MQFLEHFKELTLHPKNAQELKGLVLRLSLQGKLTKKWREENPGIEPASVLLERIRIEKNRIVQSTRIKKDRPFPSVTEYEMPYDLPKGWEICQMGDVIKISSGNGLTSSKMDEFGKIPVYGGNGITGYHSSGNVEEGTIIIGRVGYYCGSIHLTKEIAWVTDNAFITRYSKENIDREFLFWLLKGTNLKENENATAQPVISGRKVYPIVISLPPLEEQKAIVEVVNQLFAEVKQLEALTKKRIQLKSDFVTSALNQLTQAAEQDTASQWTFLQEEFGTFFTEKENIKKLREGILQLAVQGKLTRDWRTLQQTQGIPIEHASTLLEKIKAEKEDLIKEKKIKKEKPLPEILEEEIPNELPEGWVWCRLKGLGTISGGGTPSKSKSIYWDGDIPWVSPKDMKSEYIETSQDMITLEAIENSSTKLISEGSLLIVGRSGILKRTIPISINKVECTVNQDMKVVSPFLTDMNIFIRLALKGMEKSLLKDYVKYGMTVHSLKYTEFELLPVPLPPLEEQKAIVEKVNALLILCDKLEQEIETHQTNQEQWMQSCLREVVER